jgi:hypothetical protein
MKTRTEARKKRAKDALKKVVIYERVLNQIADWEVPDDRMNMMDEPGAAAIARDALREAGAHE